MKNYTDLQKKNLEGVEWWVKQNLWVCPEGVRVDIFCGRETPYTSSFPVRTFFFEQMAGGLFMSIGFK